METTLVVRARTPTPTQLEEVLIDLDLPVGRTVNYHEFLRRFVPAHEPPARPGAGEPAHWRIRTPRELRHAPAVDGRQLLEEFRVGCRPTLLMWWRASARALAPARGFIRTHRSHALRHARAGAYNTDEHVRTHMRAHARAHIRVTWTRARARAHTRALS